MPTPKQQYIRKLNEIAGRYGNLEDTTIRRTLSMLKELRRDISAALVVGGTDWQAFRLSMLRQNVSALIDQFERKLTTEMRAAMIATQEHGAQSVTEPLEQLGDLDDVDIPTATGGIGVQAQFLRPVAAQVNVALDFTADLIQNIVAPMRARINRELQLAALGRKKPFDVMRSVTDILGVEARASIWGRRRDPVRGVAARAETDVRTELQRMFNLSNHSQQLAVRELVPGLMKSWVAAADTRTRRSHLVAHLTYRNRPIPVDQPFILTVTTGRNRGRRFRMMYPGDPAGPPELVINCLPGDTEVYAPDVVAGMRSWYDGPMIELILATGDQLTVTPNHPILGLGSFVPAQFFQEGDYVLTCSGGDGAGLVPTYKNDRPTLIQEIFRSLTKPVGVFGARVDDFHGDGMFIKGQVNIVTSDGLLGADVSYSHRSQKRLQMSLGGAGLALTSFPALGTAHQLGLRTALFSAGLVRRPDLVSALLAGHARPFERFRLALSSGCNPMFLQMTVEDLARYVQLASEFIGRFAAQITLNPVVKVRNRDFRGHVFDLSTKRGYFISGIIPCANCRCKMATIHPHVGLVGSSLDGRIAAEVNRRGLRLPAEARRQEAVVWCQHGNGFLVDPGVDEHLPLDGDRVIGSPLVH